MAPIRNAETDPSVSGVSRAVLDLSARIASFQLLRPRLVLVVCALLTGLGLWGATQLKLRTEFDQLLPESQPSVRELHRVASRVAGVSNLFIVLEGDDTTRLRALADKLVPALSAIGPPWVGATEDGVQPARNFLMPRSGLFASLDELTKLRDDIQARWDYEVSRKLGTDLGSDEPPPPVDVSHVRARFAARSEVADLFPDGYYQAKDGKTVVVAVHAAIPAGELARSQEVVRRVNDVVRPIQNLPEFSAIHVGLTGDLATSLAEYSAVRDDLVEVGAIGAILVLGVVLLYYLRIRALVALGLTIVIGCSWTFGATKVLIGHLNVATGFLFSIVAGNGINFGIIYLSRYLEERRHGVSVDLAIRVAHKDTWLPTLTAGLAAAAAYGSLGVTDFRGFKHFAVIGSFGMVLCWIATYAALPAILVVIERVAPFVSSGGGRIAELRQAGARYDAPFAWFVNRAPRVLTVMGLALGVVGGAMVVRYARSDPMEYDMKHLRNDVGSRAEQLRLSALSSSIVGEANASSMAIVCDRVDQVGPLKQALEAKRDAAPAGAKPFESVRTLLDFVPDDQAAKLPILREIRDRLVRAHARGIVTDADWRAIEPLLPPATLTPFSVADLPADLARPFTERDGTRGRIVYIEPTDGADVDDVHYLIRWADSFRSTTLPNGEIILGSGRAVIYADMLRTIVTDAPKAVVVSFAMTTLVVLLTFRRGKRTLVVIATLLVGVAWLGALLVAGGVRLNFLNFIALPITFGIGVDYAVNVAQRYGQDGSKGILTVLKSTGGAVILCSLTTTLGYMALLRSLNQAVRSLGVAAVLGEVCCLTAAVLVLPAAFLWRERIASRAETRPAAADAA